MTITEASEFKNVEEANYVTLQLAGPFNFEAGKGGLPTLHLNPYSWSKVPLYLLI